MTAPRDSGALPGHHELDAVCGALGLNPSGARMLVSRSNAVFHLPAADIVVRLSSDTLLAAFTANKAIVDESSARNAVTEVTTE